MRKSRTELEKKEHPSENNRGESMQDLMESFLLQQRYQIKESTFAHYQNLCQTHIAPELGQYRCAEIQRGLLEEYASRMLFQGRLDGCGGLSAKTVRDLLILLRSILRYGVQAGKIEPKALEFALPKLNRKEVSVLSLDEQSRLEAYSRDGPAMRFGVYLCLYTGLRIGELCALTWDDIDLDMRCLRVTKTLTRITQTDGGSTKTRVIVSPPKTPSSRRSIPLPDPLLERLRELRPAGAGNAYFLTGTRQYKEPRSYYNCYQRYLRECGIPHSTFHALRHTFATRCIEKGVDPKTLSEILGHADVSITLSCYVHSSEEHKRRCMELLFT